MNSRNFLLAVSVAAGLGLACTSAMAESETVGGSGSADARLDFQVNVPGVLRFRVGTSGAGNIDQIVFSPTATEFADGNTVNGTGGDAGGGAVNVAVFSNRGQVQIEENNGGDLTETSGGADTIGFSAIQTTSTSGDLPAPALSDSGGNTANVTPSSGNFTDRTAVWTYTLDTSGIQAEAGTYEGRVTYTASVTP